MANCKSAKKRILVIKTKTARNRALKTNLKTVLKKANVAIETNAANKNEAVAYAVKRIDQACAKGLIHKNCANRKKSQIVRKLNNA